MWQCQDHVDIPAELPSASVEPSHQQVQGFDEEVLQRFANWRLEEEEEKSADKQPPLVKNSDCVTETASVGVEKTKLPRPPYKIRQQRSKTNSNPINQQTIEVQQSLPRRLKDKKRSTNRRITKKPPSSTKASRPKRLISQRWLNCSTCDYKSRRLDYFDIHMMKFHGVGSNENCNEEDNPSVPKRFKPLNDDELMRQFIPVHRQNAVVVLSSALTNAINSSLKQLNSKGIATESDPNSLLEKKLMQICSRSFLSPTAFNQFTDLVENEKVNINYVDSEGLTPILRLCLHHKRLTLFDCIQLMLLKRKDIDVNWRHGANPLEGTDGCFNALAMLARHYRGSNLYEIAHLLLKHTVHPGVSDINGDNALIVLCANYKDKRLLDVVRLFLGSQEIKDMINRTNSKGWSALFVLCYNYKEDNLMDIVQLLIDNGASVKSKDKSGWDCLLAIAVEQHGHKDFADIVRLLISKGADINSTDNRESFGIFHILCANYKGDQLVHLIQILLLESECEADLNVASTGKDSGGWTPIYFLSANQKQTQHFCTILSLFVQNDVQLNHRDEEGRSFLHLICNSQMNVDRTQVILNILTQVAQSDLALDISAEDHRRMKPVDYLKRQKKMDQNIKDKLIQLFDVIAAPKKTESTTANPTQINNIELTQSSVTITSPIPTAEPEHSVTLVSPIDMLDFESPMTSVIHVHLQPTIQPTPTPSPTGRGRLQSEIYTARIVDSSFAHTH